LHFKAGGRISSLHDIEYHISNDFDSLRYKPNSQYIAWRAFQ
jgi:hypothetical protein